MAQLMLHRDLLKTFGKLPVQVQKRIADLEKWRREISEWKVSASENSDNLEETIASILNEQLSDIDIQPDEKKKSSIPTPRK